MKPLNLAEVKELAGDLEEKKELKDYLKKFEKLSAMEAKNLKEKLGALGKMKLKGTHIAKIVDFLPKTTEELNKIFTDISFDERETNEILEIVKGY